MKFFHYFLLSLATSLLIVSCDKADENYKKFTPEGEIVYSGKVDSLIAKPGKNRIELQWLLISDTHVSKCIIFWNNKLDSIEIAIQRERGVDTIRKMIDNLPEGPYIFEVYTYNPNKAPSIKSEVYGDVYGDAYESNIINRTLRSIKVSGQTTRLQWDQADLRSPGVQLNFRDQSDQLITKFIPSSESLTILDVIPQNGSVEFQTLFLPVTNAIDTLRAPVHQVNF